MTLAIFEDTVWQMSLGERAAVEGVLSALRPSLAIEIGSAEGACLRQIAGHAQQVHSFDLQPPSLPLADNVVLHTGDSHALLPPFLEGLAEQGANVDFAMIDGDHTPEGVRRDIEDLLNSPALARAVLLIHDVANERVRAGVDAVHFAAWPKVAHVELDWIPGRLFAEPALRNELWFGLGLIVVDAGRLAYKEGSVYEHRYHPSAPLLAQIRELVLAREFAPPGMGSLEDEANQLRQRTRGLAAQLAAQRQWTVTLEAELSVARHRIAGAERALDNIKGSASWKMTEPFRGAKRLVGRPKG